MPRELLRAPNHDRRKSLGWLANAWMEYFVVHGPGDIQGEPVVHGDEYAGFVVDCCAVGVEATNNHLLYDSAFFSRPKGCDKSGMGARFVLWEALGPCRFAGWAKGGEIYRDPWGLGFEYVYVKGEPMGRPVHVPFIRIMATEEDQTGAVFDSVFYNLTDEDAPLSKVPGVKAVSTRVDLPGGGEITPSTASSASKDGGKETFVVFDETHLYITPTLREMYKTVTRNMRKRKKNSGTWYLETTTMYAPDQRSVAEATYLEAKRIKERKPKRQRLLYDHRWGQCEDLTNLQQLRQAILDAFGEAIAWNDMQSTIDEFHDSRAATQDSRRYFLNAATETADAWFMGHEIEAIFDGSKTVRDRDTITLGFDGSRKRSRGVADATALVGFHLAGRHVFEIRIWEQPEKEPNWEVPRVEVEAEVRNAFRRYNVIGFYADPAKWEDVVGRWEATYGNRLKVKSTREHPIQWWMTGGRAAIVVAALKRFYEAVIDKEITYDGASTLTRHLRNARRRLSKEGVQISKKNPDSPDKIDGTVAAVLAVTAGYDALAAGIDPNPSNMLTTAARIR